MPKLVRRYLEPGYVDLGLVFDELGPLLFHERWINNKFTKKRPFYVRNVDLDTGKELCRVRKKLVTIDGSREVDYDPYDLPQEDVALAKDAAAMWREIYEYLVGSAVDQSTPSIILISRAGAYIPFSAVPPGRWFRIPHVVICTGYLDTGVADGYGRVTITQPWLTFLKSQLSGKRANDIPSPNDRAPGVPLDSTLPIGEDQDKRTAERNTSPPSHRPNLKTPLLEKALTARYGVGYRHVVREIPAPQLARQAMTWINENNAWPSTDELPAAKRVISPDLVKTHLGRRNAKPRLPPVR